MAEQVSDTYLEELKVFNEEKDLGLDIDSVEAGTGAIMLHYNLFSRIEHKKAERMWERHFPLIRCREKRRRI